MIKECLQCSEPFEPGHNKQKYCSVECRNAAGAHKSKSDRKKRCASPNCNEPVSENIDSPYCKSCFMSDSIMAKDLRKIKRKSSG